jgi:AP-2 complex subunit beta-1
MEGLMYFVPEESSDAEMIVERILPRLQHVNSAIALTTIKVIMYLTNYIASDSKVEILYNKLGTPLVTLLHNTQEIQYIALKNILLILHKYPGFLRKELKVFFVKYSDPIYVKLTKLDIIYKRTDRDNISQVLPELKE